MQKIRTAPVPPPSRETNWVERVKPGEVLRYIILSQNMWGPITHWSGHRTIVCTDDPKTCVGCQRKLPTRWKGYLHCWNETRNSLVFLELTPRAARALLADAPKDKPLRCVRIELQRSGKAANGRLCLKVIGVARDGYITVAEENPEATLRRLWQN